MFRFFHLCTHQTDEADETNNIRDIHIINDGDATDILIKGARISRILEVRAITFKHRVDRDTFEYDKNFSDLRYEDVDLGDGYYDGENYFYIDYRHYMTEGSSVSNPLPESFYTPYLHNRMKWLVEPPLTYVVRAEVLYGKSKKTIHAQSSCPVCQGKGWFIDILNNDQKFNVDKDIEKIAQRVVKDLMTELYSNVLKLEYGTTIKQTIASVSKPDDELFDDVRLIISEVEDNYLVRQQEEYDQLDSTERMIALRAENIFRSPSDPRRVVLELYIETEEEARTFRLFI